MTKGVRKYMLILNPHSGTGAGNAASIEESLKRVINKSGDELEIRRSEYAGHCAKLAREAVDRQFYSVIAAGGDGTVNEVASALVGTTVVMGIIPCGSGNGLARHLGLSIDIDNAIRIISDDFHLPSDYGTANSRPFFCTFGLGFDAAVSQAFSAKKRRGLNSYLKSVFEEYFKYKARDYEIVTGEKIFRVKAFIIAVCNASQYGNNAFIAPEASIHDGLLDITIIHAGNPLTRALVGVDLLTGYLNKNVLIQTLKVENAVIRQLPGPAHLDGDPVNMPYEIKIRCHPGRLNLFIDKRKPKFHPLLTPIRSLRFDLMFHLRSLSRHLFPKKESKSK